MFLIADSNKNLKKTPWVTGLLLLLNIIIFLFGLGSLPECFLVPAEITTGNDIIIPEFLGATIKPVYLTLISSQFLHGGWLHIIGNMFFLFIFGNNIEEEIGHLQFLFFYLLSGVAAGLLHVALTYAFDANPMIPCLGASGAISGLVACYILLFPRNKLYILLLFFRRFPVSIPINAFFWGLMWMSIQIFGTITLIIGTAEDNQIAYAAHLGGALFGFIYSVLFFRNKIKQPFLDA